MIFNAEEAEITPRPRRTAIQFAMKA